MKKLIIKNMHSVNKIVGIVFYVAAAFLLRPIIKILPEFFASMSDLGNFFGRSAICTDSVPPFCESGVGSWYMYAIFLIIAVALIYLGSKKIFKK
jgi:hypothetical protein